MSIFPVWRHDSEGGNNSPSFGQNLGQNGFSGLNSISHSTRSGKRHSHILNSREFHDGFSNGSRHYESSDDSNSDSDDDEDGDHSPNSDSKSNSNHNPYSKGSNSYSNSINIPDSSLDDNSNDDSFSDPNKSDGDDLGSDQTSSIVLSTASQASTSPSTSFTQTSLPPTISSSSNSGATNAPNTISSTTHATPSSATSIAGLPSPDDNTHLAKIVIPSILGAILIVGMVAFLFVRHRGRAQHRRDIMKPPNLKTKSWYSVSLPGFDRLLHRAPLKFTLVSRGIDNADLEAGGAIRACPNPKMMELRASSTSDGSDTNRSRVRSSQFSIVTLPRDS